MSLKIFYILYPERTPRYVSKFRAGIVLLLILQPATHVRSFFSHIARTKSRREPRQIELLRVYSGVSANFSRRRGGGGESLFFVLREFSRSCALLPPGVTAFLMITRQNEGKLCNPHKLYNMYTRHTFTSYRKFPLLPRPRPYFMINFMIDQTWYWSSCLTRRYWFVCLMSDQD